MKLTTMSGFLHLLPAEQLVFNHMLETVRKVYESVGAVPVDAPVMDRAEVLLAKAGGETEQQVYRLTKGDTDLVLRFDHTVPLAKFVAQNLADLNFPLKVYNIGKVYRGERAQKGRLREFYQCDIDIIGSGSLSVNYDAELIWVVSRALAGIGFDDFVVGFNNRRMMSGLFQHLGIYDLKTQVFQAIDRLPKAGPEIVTEMLQETGVSSDRIDKLLEIITLKGTPSQVLEELEKLDIQQPLFKTGLDELAQVAKTADMLGVPDKHKAVDLSIVRGLDYYTGTVYETFSVKHPEFGSIYGGGRYDDLAGHYTSHKLPGVGVSMGLSRLFAVMKESGLIKAHANTSAKVMIAPMDGADDAQVGMACDLQCALAAAGIPALIVWETYKNFKTKMAFMSKLGAKYAAIIGGDEAAKGTVVLKDMGSGVQQALSIREIVEKVGK